MQLTRNRRPHNTLRIHHLARLADMTQVDLRMLLQNPPFALPEPDGADDRGPFWSLEREREWRSWFSRYRALPAPQRPWWR